MDAIDAVLHLLDRQVVDRDGLMVCKVDDVELTLTPDGRWEVTGLLAGPPALVPRFGGSSARGSRSGGAGSACSRATGSSRGASRWPSWTTWAAE